MDRLSELLPSGTEIRATLVSLNTELSIPYFSEFDFKLKDNVAASSIILPILPVIV